MILKPWRAEYAIGRDAYGRAVTLKTERRPDGVEVFEIHRAAADQRDHEERVTGLTLDNIRALVAAFGPG